VDLVENTGGFHTAPYSNSTVPSILFIEKHQAGSRQQASKIKKSH